MDAEQRRSPSWGHGHPPKPRGGQGHVHPTGGSEGRSHPREVMSCPEQGQGQRGTRVSAPQPWPPPILQPCALSRAR